MILLAWLGTALAGPADPVDSVRTWATSAVDVRPDLAGDPRFRLAQRLGFVTAARGGWQFVATGGVRAPALSDKVLPDVWRLTLAHEGERTAVQLGRFVHQDARGLLRVDGLAVDVHSEGVNASAWAGRRWHPDVAAGQAWVAGSQVRLLNGGMGPQLAVGVEARQERGSLAPRAWGAVETRDLRGDRASAVVEVGAKGRARGVVSGSLAAGRWLDVGADARWEGLPQAVDLDDVRSPLAWLAPEGYGVASARASWRRGRLDASVQGGPTVRRDVQGTIGGQARAAVGIQARSDLYLTAYALLAALEQEGLGGGGLSARVSAMGLDVVADGAAWRLRPLDGAAALVGEARLLARGSAFRWSVGDEGRALQLGTQLAAGSDRQRGAFVRGGLDLTVLLGGAP